MFKMKFSQKFASYLDIGHVVVLYRLKRKDLKLFLRNIFHDCKIKISSEKYILKIRKSDDCIAFLEQLLQLQLQVLLRNKFGKVYTVLDYTYIVMSARRGRSARSRVHEREGGAQSSSRDSHLYQNSLPIAKKVSFNNFFAKFYCRY